MRISPDRAQYLSRVLHQKLKADRNLMAESDDDTMRRAITREVGEAARELEAIEEKARADIERRKGPSARDFDILFARAVDDELRKHGA